MASTTQSWAAATQSWASWLLDSYAASVSPVASDSSFYHNDDSQSSVTEISYEETKSPITTTISMSPAYGPYLRTGRGGAGNFNWQADLKLAPRSNSPVDLEANVPQRQISLAERRKATARLDDIDTKDALRSRQHSAQYLGIGRGGAGNYTPNDVRPIQRSATLPATLISPITPRSPSPNPRNPFPPPHPGRGGAGNYAAAADANGRVESQKQHVERLAAQLRREQIVGEVNELLQPPPGAWLGGRRKSAALYEV